MLYLARWKESQIYLLRDDQMDTCLEQGAEIYSEDEKSGEETLIATPEKGFLAERPVFPVKETFTPA